MKHLLTLAVMLALYTPVVVLAQFDKFGDTQSYQDSQQAAQDEALEARQREMQLEAERANTTNASGNTVPAQNQAQGLPPTSAPQKDLKKEAEPPQKTLVAETPCGGMICNPLKGVNSISDLIFKIINFAYSLSYAVIAVFLVISGFKFVAAQGNESALTDAKNTFKYTIIGAILLIGANVITQVIKSLIESFKA